MNTRLTSACTTCGAIPQYARRYCKRCYQRAYRSGKLAIRRITPRRFCRVLGCTLPYMSGGYCRMHEMRQRRHGDPLIVQRPGRKPQDKRS